MPDDVEVVGADALHDGGRSYDKKIKDKSSYGNAVNGLHEWNSIMACSSVSSGQVMLGASGFSLMAS